MNLYRPGLSRFSGVTFFFILLNVIVLIPLPNMGGQGLKLPINLLSWTFIGLITFWVMLTSKSERINLPKGFYLIFLGAAFWSMPLVFTPHRAWRIDSSPHVMALWGLIFLWLMLSQIKLTRQQGRRWLEIIVISAFAQAGYGLLQAFHQLDNVFVGVRPYGSFQQVNVLSSFLATGASALFWLMITADNKRRHLTIFSSLMLFTLAFVLYLAQSRAGMIGFVSAIMILTVTNKKSIRTCFVPLFVIFSGFIIAYLWQHNYFQFLGVAVPDGLDIVDKTGSNNQRAAILKNTLLMIIAHPLMGVGYGGFEKSFADMALLQGGPFISESLTHPHNELLYAWSEGGLLAILGIVIIIFAMITLLYKSSRNGKWAGIALLTPIAVHMNLEYPLYQSVFHSIIIIFIFFIFTVNEGNEAKFNSSAQSLWRYVGALYGCFLILFMVSGLITEIRMTKIEQLRLQPFIFSSNSLDSLPNTLSQRSRLDYDEHISLLLKYNITHNKAYLLDFMTWSDEYLNIHNDANVYASKIAISYALNQHDKANEICNRAVVLFPSHHFEQCKK